MSVPVSPISRRCLICVLPAGAAAPVLAAPPANAQGKKVIATRKVPVKGGVIVSKRGVVVTQPKKGKFRVFSSTCTHQGCSVSSVGAKTIGCPCHGSQFSTTNGFVVQGPATEDLPKVPFTIEDGIIYLT